MFAKSQKSLLIFLVVAFSIGIGVATNHYLRQRTLSLPNSLYATLDYYGFKSTPQKDALRFLLKESGIKNTDDLLDAHTTSQDALSKKILTFVTLTQEHFTIRSGNQERWDVQTPTWMKNPKIQAEILNALVVLNLTNEILPSFKQRDVVCILGASKGTMVSRLEYAENLFSQGMLSAQRLVLLTGERYITVDKNGVSIDGNQQELTALAKKINKNTLQLTETDLMKEAYQSSKLYQKLPTEMIDTPKGDLPRATTETTIIQFIGWLRQHPEISSVTFVSNQPHVEYQKAIITQVFGQEKVSVKFEVIGQQYASPADDKITYLIGALGSQIWAKTPKLLETMHIEITDPELKQAFIALYRKQPLMYNNLIINFKPK
jgi:hypothetical protein